jgi:hypothetical protein
MSAPCIQALGEAQIRMQKKLGSAGLLSIFSSQFHKISMILRLGLVPVILGYAVLGYNRRLRVLLRETAQA